LAGEVGVRLPVLERPANPAVLLGVVGELGPGGEVGAVVDQGLFNLLPLQLLFGSS
jgi:hypothetical protein